MMKPHFGFHEVNNVCIINFYYEDGATRRELVTTIRDAVEAQQLCDNLNNLIPLLTREFNK
jgi:hypothetical protein